MLYTQTYKVLTLLLEQDLHLAVWGSTIMIYRLFCLIQIHL